MTTYIIRRILLAVPTLIAISIIGFTIIQLPKGDYLDRKIQELEEQYGDSSSMEMADELRKRYGLDKPMVIRYFVWVTGFIQGEFGQSFEYEVEVSELVWDRLLLTLLISITALIFTYIIDLSRNHESHETIIKQRYFKGSAPSKPPIFQ